MSLTALAWLLCFLAFSMRGLSRPMWAVYAYLLTFFAAPQLWWWGSGLVGITYNWNILAALLLAFSVLINWTKSTPVAKQRKRTWRLCIFLLVVYALNAVIVHNALAVSLETSWKNLDLILKQLVLTVLLYRAIETEEDLKGFLAAIFIGCTYIGYEVVINEAGSFHEGRLEGVLVPGASNSNGLSALLTFGILVGGTLVIQARSVYLKLFSVVGCVLILDTLLRCNSRGAFLSLICGGVWILLASKGKARKQLVVISVFGALAILMQAGDDFIWKRFDSTFATADERDGSANSRINFWRAAVEMISDRPLGSGGEAAFRSELGMTYIAHLSQNRQRAVHNGYLDIAAGWGVQGLFLLVGSLAAAFLGVFRSLRKMDSDNQDIVMLGSVLLAVFVAQLVATIFLSRLDHEVFNWLIVLCAVFCKLHTNHDDNSAQNSDLISNNPDLAPGGTGIEPFEDTLQ